MPGTCPRCQKTVYFNEEKIAMGKSFHKSCFSCANKSCKRKLDSGNLTTHHNELYCKICYGRLFGPKGYGFGVGAAVLSADSGSNGSDPSVEVGSSSDDNKPEEKAESKPQTNGGSNGTNGTNGNDLIKTNGTSPVPPKAVKVNMTFDNFGNRIDICPRCNKKVYLAEKMMGNGKAWHKMSCFNCAECHKRLESTTLCEKDGEIYCKTCYAKQWGPSGYGHGINPGIRKASTN